jgi:hypothetical protein
MKPTIRLDRLLWILVAVPALPFILKPCLSDYSVFDDKTGQAANNWFAQSRLDATPVNNVQYETECGSCHFAYPPELLPRRSWQEIMTTLDNHFGDNAELGATTQQIILDYVAANSGDTATHGRPQSLQHSIATNEMPLRITDTRYFKRKHGKIDAQAVKNNPDIGSFSQCNACHVHAKQGIFNGHDVKIPPMRQPVETTQS